MHPHPPRAALLRRANDVPFADHTPASLVRVGLGMFVRTEEGESLFADGRLRTRVQVVRDRLGPGLSVVSHFAALAERGLAVEGVRGDHIDLIVPSDTTRHSARDVRRYQHPLSDADIVTIDGMEVTSLERTIFDVIRLGSFETDVVALAVEAVTCGADHGVAMRPPRLGGCRDARRLLARQREISLYP